ncbi:MAG TPA: tRNA lysidine(34) synthetase TilS [Gammaproteobacteria bacterium]|nr:tRNA lysidine(34) synthetase TilS [Gammaproteobacteria bacterium]
MDLTPARVLSALNELPVASRYRVAFSGGLDSTVLLHTLVQALDNPARRLAAVHVHHGLHGQAEAWAAHCERVCVDWAIPCRILRVDARPAAGESPEAAARRARYAALAQVLAPGEGLLTAHHQDDQAETLLLQLLRGAGSKGLAGMPLCAPFAGGWLGRPLMEWSRGQLREYAERYGLVWVDDPSNADTGVARNALRHRILPRLAEHWPGAAHTLARAARHQAEAAELLVELAEADLALAGTPDGGLSITALDPLSPARRRNLIRHWLHERGLAVPDSAHLQRILEEVIEARPDAEPCVAWGSGGEAQVRRYRDRLYALHPAAVCPGQGPVAWDLSAALSLRGLERELTVGPVRGGGLSAAACAGRTITVRFRRGGERCRPVGRGHHHDLKKLMQEWGVPPWERARVPLIYVEEDLAQVVGYCLCEPFAASVDEPGWRIGLADVSEGAAGPDNDAGD